MVSAWPLIFKSSSSFTNSLGINPSVVTTISFTVNMMVHSFFKFYSKLLISLFAGFYFTSVVCQDTKDYYSAWFLFSFFLLGPCVGDPFVSQNPREVYASHSPGRILGCSCTTCSLLLLSSLFTPLEFFTSALADGFSLEFLVIASFLKSPGFFPVFWPFSVIS